MKNQLLENGIIPSVNYHLWKACNFNCKFCFGSFNDVRNNSLPKNEAKLLMKNIVNFGFEKITFSGGEPTLCPFLPELLKIAKKGGMTTMIVTNGTRISNNWLNKNYKYIDWIALSIDSILKETNYLSGRSNKNNVFGKEDYFALISTIKKFNIKLKINTVVSKFNVDEDLNSFINYVNPERWKVMQALPIKGQNYENLSNFHISEKEFKNFLNRHKIGQIVSENNYEMKGSYVMIDPIGRFFNNSKGKHIYSSPINQVGVMNALKEVNYCVKKFINRGGLYKWK